ncbi:E3 ubiquitin-protein ligase TRIM9-like isoform X2 [Saccostrea echinata]|uniref:E3 ubiquitin-protein ligase TRIM9-like isoform X2 n=1 Tax=Saccostrea echinata TaxID=191078 RepID=UPI002A8325C9|nr:E3 ubiquitin-protein ligase TRIM9-like isoform X2 [Saccostrea echinata]
MEGELKCPMCLQFYCNPLLLPCSHSICASCASNIQESSQTFLTQLEEGGCSSTPGEGDLKDFPDIDKISILSETDSGVVCNSRPSSYIGTPSIANIYQTVQFTQNSYGIKCPVCKKIILLDENGYKSLPCNKVLETIAEKFSHSKYKPLTLYVNCQMCEHNEAKEAVVMCEQCNVFYCQSCKESCHPDRGPLAKHNLLDTIQGRALQRARNKGRELRCLEHEEEQLGMYCMTCGIPVCCTCQHEGGHSQHDVQAIGAMCKAQKLDLSQILQSLSEKAKVGTEFIQSLKSMTDQVHGNCLDFEATVAAQCDALIDAIKKRKQELLVHVAEERDLKISMLKEQASQCTALLQRTTGLLHFSIEVLKESDPASFLQVSSGLISRVSTADQNFNKDMELTPRIATEIDLTLDTGPTLHAIQTMNFFQLKAPGKPRIVPEDCSAENNSVTIAWQPHMGNVVENYSLELDDGCGGDFRVVYVGSETICTVDGLHFNSTYYARVKATNNSGDSDYSDPISLQTAEVAWFTLDPFSAHPDILFSNDNHTATCNSYEHRILLGGVGFSKGVHYWEVIIDRYDKHSDPAIGIARFDVDKCQMLGKDEKGWSMYIDDGRSWFMHSDEHSERTDGGIKRGSVIGVLLDLDRHRLCYFVDSIPHGPVAFKNLHGVFFPALSINRNVQVTLRTGLEPPAESESDDE